MHDNYNTKDLDAYTKMTLDSFKTQLQTVLTAYYEDIKGIQGTSGCSMPKFVKHQFKDPKNAKPTPEDCTALPPLDLAATPATVATEAPPPGAWGSLRRSFQLRLQNGPSAQQERWLDGSGRIDRADAD